MRIFSNVRARYASPDLLGWAGFSHTTWKTGRYYENSVCRRVCPALYVFAPVRNTHRPAALPGLEELIASAPAFHCAFSGECHRFATMLIHNVQSSPYLLHGIFRFIDIVHIDRPVHQFAQFGVDPYVVTKVARFSRGWVCG